MRIELDDLAELARVGSNYPRFVEWLDRWRDDELRTLPIAQENLRVRQGRCQVLSEIVENLKDAPDLLKQRTGNTPV